MKQFHCFDSRGISYLITAILFAALVAIVLQIKRPGFVDTKSWALFAVQKNISEILQSQFFLERRIACFDFSIEIPMYFLQNMKNGMCSLISGLNEIAIACYFRSLIWIIHVVHKKRLFPILHSFWIVKTQGRKLQKRQNSFTEWMIITFKMSNVAQ